MHALRQEILPPSGVEFAASLNLTPSCLSPSSSSSSSSLHSSSSPTFSTSNPNGTTNARHEFTSRVLCNLVVARSSLLRIFEVREEPAPLPVVSPERERERVRKGTEAVEGEVEMDESGEGFVNIAKSSTQKAFNQTTTKLYFIREHRLHGIVTGLEGVKTLASTEDRLDRLVVSFKDAKIALLEWSDAIADLVTVSIHTYERAPQLMSLDSPLFRALLRADPSSRCAALSLPNHAIAILPFHQVAVDLDVDVDVVMDAEAEPPSSRIPYAPSFILDLPSQVDPHIRNVIDFVFLPGFNNPTMAVLYQTEQTWTGRLKEYKDTTLLTIFTLDIESQSYPTIRTLPSLPHDAFSLLPCSTALGGVVILTPNSLIYVDQGSRRVGVSVSGWAGRVSEFGYVSGGLGTSSAPGLGGGQGEEELHLEGARGVWVDDRTFFLVLKDGTVYPVEIVVDGRVVSGMSVGRAVARSTIPSCALRLLKDTSGSSPAGLYSTENEKEKEGKEERMGAGDVFVGSTVGPSVLLRTSYVEVEVDEDESGEGAGGGGNGIGNGVGKGKEAVVKDEMDWDDDDDDIYGTSTKVEEPTASKSEDEDTTTSKPKKTRTQIHLSLRDALPAHGPIASMAFSLARNGDKYVPELVCATGAGELGGFTLFQRDIPTRTKRKLHLLGGSRGMWSLPIRQVKGSGGGGGGMLQEKAVNQERQLDTLIVSTDVNPSPGFSRIAVRSNNQKADIAITTRITVTTIGVAPFFQRTAILHVMTNAIRVLEPDGTERQSIKDMDGNIPRPKIRACSISDPFVLIIREDDSIGLFIETDRGKIRRKDMSPMGDKTSRYLAGCFYTDSTGLFDGLLESSAAAGNTTTTLQAASGDKGTQWLILVRPQGIMEIWTLPKLALAFSTAGLTSLENVLSDSYDIPALSLPQDPPRKPQELDVEQILLAPIGESSPIPHLCVFMRSGQLTVYEALPAALHQPQPTPPSNTRTAYLKIKFVKTASRAFEIQRPEEGERSIIAEQKKVMRLFVPFVTSPSPGVTYSGVFFTGDRPNWILGTDKGGLQVYPSGHAVVHAFTPCSLWESKGDFLLYTEEGPSLLEWMPDFQLDGPLPLRSVPRGRPYSSVVFDPSTSLIVGAATLQAQFTSFDEDGNRIWAPDAPNVSDPKCDCSTLELISPDAWITMDGFEFATNEYINDMACVSLETSSTETGIKDFIAVGTTIDRGEDLAAKGATYIFEIVEVVPDPAIAPKRWYKLRLRCRDDAKGPVTAVCGFNGYLVSSMGQKIFVRAFDADERLVGVAFMDVGVYVTSLRTLKNLLLIGDAVKSVSFVAFQEDPYKLVLVARDIHRVCVTSAEFFFTNNDLSIVTGDEEGILRVYEYSPDDTDTHDSRNLLLRTEFHGQCEYRATTVIARRVKDDPIPQAKLLMGSTDGSLSALVAVDEQPFKRLQLLQGQLTRNIQHTAGLNPRAFRIVRNDYVSKPLSKGILDGNLLLHYESLPIPRQNAMTRQIGTERKTVLRDWMALCGPW